MANFLEKLLRTGEGRTLKKLRQYTDAINALSEEFSEMSDAELREETDRFKKRYQDGESLESLLPEAFAAVREASGRTLGMRHFDVQLMGGAALHLGNIAEMKTGEGKTLVATAPAYLNALTGGSVHIITVNDYLATYQSELMGRVFRFLGMETGCIQANMSSDNRRKQYAADITYGTNNEFGFDYLRDNMAWSSEELVQRGHAFAIVDEVDSILIDEARTPLIISGPAEGDGNRWYEEFAKVVKRLKTDRDYEVDEKKRTVGILEPGIERVEDYLGIGNLYDAENTPLISFLNNAIRAKELFKKDKDYVILDDEVLIVDEHTGRVLKGRRYNEGLHQAIEAKENVKVQAENQTLATITLQNFFRLYKKLSGMTGTAETEAAEFMSTYKLGVVPIPTNKPMQRVDQSDLVYKNEVSKFDAVVDDIAERHETGQPVLVGTTSVEKSEYLSKHLAKRGIRHEVLNAKNHAGEASIVAMAGRKAAVTVATNMAGRGTDIMLGGNAEFIAVSEMEKRGLDPQEDEEQYEAQWHDVLKAAEKRVKTEAKEVIEAGGLYVLGTERHESRRIDNQLRGRSGRQGDPGESRFYLSLTDDLMRLFGSGAAERIMATANVPDDVPLESKMVSRAILSAQSQIEQRNAEQRKNVLKYDDVLNRQRTVIYDERRSVLDGADLEEQVSKFREEVIDAYVVEATTGPVEDWKVDELFEALGKIYEPSITEEDLADEVGGIGNLTKNRLNREIQSDIKVFYEQREEALGEEATRELERRVVLSVIDKRWREHLYEMDYLKNGIGLRAMAQKDPLVEYQREGFDMFKTMQDGIREDVVRLTNTLQVTVNRSEDESDDDSDVEVDAAELRHTTPKMQLSAPSESGSSAMSESEDDEAETDQPANRAQRRAKKKAKS
ncbi:MAG: preprotein translocase subunit SecA [Brevibacterium sp.]|uniref:preprotein translocase subunit SecA n=1 Tax=Brevibacterium sp. TaxID=1701 RepID=UPI0026487892|nr:preprotein translocase subunit SecA [Brevibacterium sp.]MDN5806030.1 preprotein translocase subunit SecA [Brevibacterium sp.]MDN5832539.1 preprotein translocase subunit SecA [Brevibacterium sp.]MDN5875214.1 preprotein translocase subunit SecA [Brevibacterium sp.]MDN5908225.1 preprotein translocase subunit SecA [Brevibacterium sp.]MDN6132976.1 preprotein translocase subunit SecA [Brevibacterium sp.]